MQAPGDVTRGTLQVLQALAAAVLLYMLDEVVEGAADALEEELVARQELAVPLQQVHGDRQHPPQDVRKAVAQLQMRQYGA